MLERGGLRSGIALAALLLSGIPNWGGHAQETNAAVKTIEGSEFRRSRGDPESEVVRRAVCSHCG